MARTAVIMQPTYLPWVGYLDLIDQADVLVLLDDAQFCRRSWHHRNRIRTPRELQWLTVPIEASPRDECRICDARIKRDGAFPRQHIRAMQHNYGSAPYFDAYVQRYSEIVAEPGATLGELNGALIRSLADMLKISTPIELSSRLDVPGRRTERLVDICRRVRADRYLSPIGSLEYLAEDGVSMWQGIELRFHNYEHPAYRQAFDGFLPYTSAIDLLLNEGDRSLEILRSGRKPAMTFEEASEPHRSRA